MPSPRRAHPGRGGWRWLRRGLVLSIWAAIGAALLLLALVWDLPAPEKALSATRRPSLTLEAMDGRVIATQGDLYGEALRLREMPAAMPQALMAIEDRRFLSHPGIDPVGLLRAAWANLRAGHVVQGVLADGHHGEDVELEGFLHDLEVDVFVVHAHLLLGG